MHAHERYTPMGDARPREMHAWEVHAWEVHAWEVHAWEVHAWEVHAYTADKLSDRASSRVIIV